MPISTSEAIFLGNFADADTNEASITVEDTSIYTGTFGSLSDPLGQYETVVSYDDADSSNAIITDNAWGGAAEQISYDLGSGTVTTYVDSLLVVSLTVTYTDGSTASYTNAVMFQDSTGNLFLTNSDWAGTDLNSGTSAGIRSINVTSVSNVGYMGLFQNNLQEFVCFAAGTAIRTPIGDRPVESLKIGDLVDTLDDGPQPLQWIGVSRVALNERMTPVRIRAGALGSNLPSHDLVVSRQHRMLIRSKIVPRMFNTSEVLVAAKTLLDLDGVEMVQGAAYVTYCHLLFEKHQIIFANDAPSESLLPGPQAMQMMGAEAREELLAIFPDLGALQQVRLSARLIPKGRQQRKLAERHLKNHLQPMAEWSIRPDHIDIVPA